MLALLLFLALSKPLLYTFDPTAIATYNCPTKYTEYEGNYVFCREAHITFSKMKLADKKPADYSLRLNYVDGTMLVYYPGRCKLINYKKGIYKCPDVFTGPQP